MGTARQGSKPATYYIELKVLARLERYAKQTRRSKSQAAGYLIQRGIEAERERGVIK